MPEASAGARGVVTGCDHSDFKTRLFNEPRQDVDAFESIPSSLVIKACIKIPIETNPLLMKWMS